MPQPDASDVASASGVSANAVTLATYGQAMERWREASHDTVADAHLRFLEGVLASVPAGAGVLEIGSGTGRDAGWLEAHGVRVSRTDGCEAFVEAMREQGLTAEILNVLTDPVPEGFDLVYASAVLLHLEASDLPRVLSKLAVAAPLIAFTLKVGEGSEWSTAKTGLPRFFQYWSEARLRAVLVGTPWQVEQLWQRQGLLDEWLQVICTRA